MEKGFKGVSVETIRSEIEKIMLTGTPEIFRRLLGNLDLTSLNNTDSETSIKSLCEKVNNFVYLFPGLPSVAALCVFPRYVPIVRQYLAVEEINIASVSASFPDSQTFIEIKIDECKSVINKGADEIDIVISLGEFLDGNLDTVKSEIKTIKETVGCTHVKVILESGLIGSPELIYNASIIAMEAGADFIKTSTGKSSVSATPEAAWVMCHAIRDYHKSSGRQVGFKPAGGIATASDAMIYYSIVESVLGKSWLVPQLFRIGASRLANDLLRIVEGRETSYF